MGKKDLSEKALLKKNDVFADIINTLLGQGNVIVKREYLTGSETESVHLNSANGELEDLFRDVSKKDMRNGRIYTIWGIKNQEKVDYTMPLRCMGYDYDLYTQQKEELLDERKCKLKEKGIEEKVSFRKGDRLAPVVTLVLYWGKNWEKPCSLHDMIAIPTELESAGIQIPDYKINVIELGKLDEKTLKKFKSDFRFVAAHIRYKNSPEKLKQFLMYEDGKMDHPSETMKAIATLTKDKRYQDVQVEKEEDVTMSILYDVLVEERAQLLAESRAQRMAESMAQQEIQQTKMEIAKNMLDSMEDEKIAELTGLPVETVEMLRESEIG